MKRKTDPGSALKAERALYYFDPRHCQKQIVECPITSILTPGLISLLVIWQRREWCSDKKLMRCNTDYSLVWKNKPCQVPTRDRCVHLSIRVADHPLHRWLLTHIGRCNLSWLHTLASSKLTVTTQHLHHIVVDGSVKVPTQCTVGVRKTQTSCWTVLRKEKKKTFQIPKCHCIYWKHNLTSDSGYPITKRGTERKKKKRTEKDRKKIIMDLKRFCKKKGELKCQRTF